LPTDSHIKHKTVVIKKSSWYAQLEKRFSRPTILPGKTLKDCLVWESFLPLRA
jgi:hypothetical protein